MEFIPGASAHLGEYQLTAGMVGQRYDSYEGPPAPSPIIYSDASGRRFLEEQPEGAIRSPLQYVGLIVSHPVVMIPLLARHLVNGLDARYSTIYVEHFDSGGHLWLRLGGFLIVFLALARVLWPRARRQLGPARWCYALALLLCCLTSVAAEIETRYMLPAYLLTYILVLAPGWPNPVRQSDGGWRRFQTPVILVIAYLVFMAVVWHVASGATGHIVNG